MAGFSCFTPSLDLLILGFAGAIAVRSIHRKKESKVTEKHIKQKVQDIDKEFVEISKTPKPKPNQPKVIPCPTKKNQKNTKPVTKEEVAKVAEEIVGMDL